MCSNVTTFNYGGWGYYTDQASRFVRIENNIAHHTKSAGFHQHYGLDNVIINNIFALVNLPNDDGGIRSSAHPNSAGDEGFRSSFSFIRNIVLVDNATIFYATSNNRCGGC
jgi:hypothetical protein